MNRVVSLASYGLIAAGLAIMPISAFAGSTTNSDAKPSAAVPVVTPPSGAHAAATAKPVVTPGKDVKHDGAKVTTAAPASSTTAAPAATSGAPATPKTGG